MDFEPWIWSPCKSFSVSGAVDLRRGLIELLIGPPDYGEIGMLFIKELIHKGKLNLRSFNTLNAWASIAHRHTITHYA